MTLRFKPADRPMRRHDVVVRQPERLALTARDAHDLASDPLVASWVDMGWPLIGRRAMPGEPRGVPLGLPLPPFAGKRRIPLLMRPR